MRTGTRTEGRNQVEERAGGRRCAQWGSVLVRAEYMGGCGQPLPATSSEHRHTEGLSLRREPIFSCCCRGWGLSDMKHLFPGSWTQNPELLRVLEGKTVSVTCMYDPLYNSDEKIWCKQIDNLCYPLVSKGAEKPRFSILQSSKFNFFTVTMSKLRMSDSGIYHCGIAVNTRIIYLRSIHLVVSKGELPLPCGSRPS